MKGRRGEQEKGKVKEREGEEAEGGIWPTQKFWLGAPYELQGSASWAR